jgi:hypothetical protein
MQHLAFRNTSHIRWLLARTAPRVHRILSPYNRRLELDDRTLARGTGFIERALRDRQYLTRTELGDRLQRVGLPMAGQRLAQLAMHAELEGVICSGPRRGKQLLAPSGNGRPAPRSCHAMKPSPH